MGLIEFGWMLGRLGGACVFRNTLCPLRRTVCGIFLHIELKMQKIKMFLFQITALLAARRCSGEHRSLPSKRTVSYPCNLVRRVSGDRK